MMTVWRVAVCIAVTLGIGLGSGDCPGAVSLGISPPIADLSVPPGGEHVIDVKVFNQGDSHLSVRAYVSAIKLSTNGTPVPLDTPEGKWSCAGWITLDKQAFELPPGGDESVHATLRVPRGTSGGRYAAILFEASPALVSRGPLDVALGTRVGTIVMETIPRTLTRQGEIRSAETSKPGQDGVRFTIRFRNSGNIHLKTRGSVVIKSEEGRIVDRVPLEAGTGTVLPDGIRQFSGTWRNLRKMVKGDYTGEVRIDAAGMRTVSDVVAFSVD